MLEIDEMIQQEVNREAFDLRIIRILERLKELNKEASNWMHQFGKAWKSKYKTMWSKPFWKEARELIREYYMIKNGDVCHACGKSMTKTFVLHHGDENGKFYPKQAHDLFTPIYCRIVHDRKKCHFH